MKIKEFCTKYNNCATESLKEDFLRDNLEIKSYLPFVNKITLAGNLANHTMLDKNTNAVKVDSCVNYLLFVRTIIEQYTNLEVETEGFFEEYDMLNASGLLDKILNMIPEKEINEFKMLCDFRKNDLLTNKYEIHGFVSGEVTRFAELAGVTLKPVLNKIAESIEKMDDKDIEKLGNKIEKALKRAR